MAGQTLSTAAAVMKKALITGITGQDGTYLAELLLSMDYALIGLGRHVDNSPELLAKATDEQLKLLDWNPHDQRQITQVIKEHQPDEIYNLAAYSSGEGMFEDPVELGEINALTVVRLLEAIRECAGNVRFCQASSREIFGEAIESPQHEGTERNPRSPYGAAKLYADNMIKLYRQRYDLYCCSAILYNHESPLRALNFVTRKISHAAASIKMGLAHELHLGNLDSERDWGFAGDFVRGMWLMLQQDHPDDFLFATGKSHTVRQLCDIAFSAVDLDYREYVHRDEASFRQEEPAILVGCAEKAAAELNWRPTVEFEDLVKMMVTEDLKLLSNGSH